MGPCTEPDDQDHEESAELAEFEGHHNGLAFQGFPVDEPLPVDPASVVPLVMRQRKGLFADNDLPSGEEDQVGVLIQGFFFNEIYREIGNFRRVPKIFVCSLPFRSISFLSSEKHFI